jgi:hypothetical protein
MSTAHIMLPLSRASNLAAPSERPHTPRPAIRRERTPGETCAECQDVVGPRRFSISVITEARIVPTSNPPTFQWLRDGGSWRSGENEKNSDRTQRAGHFASRGPGLQRLHLSRCFSISVITRAWIPPLVRDEFRSIRTECRWSMNTILEKT